MKSRVKFHVDYNGQPTIDLSISCDRQEDSRDILANNMMDVVKYPSIKKNVPFDLPSGLFAVKELFEYSDGCTTGSYQEPTEFKYTLVPLSRLDLPYVLKEEPKKINDIKSALGELEMFFDLLRFRPHAFVYLMEKFKDEEKSHSDGLVQNATLNVDVSGTKKTVIDGDLVVKGRIYGQ